MIVYLINIYIFATDKQNKSRKNSKRHEELQTKRFIKEP